MNRATTFTGAITGAGILLIYALGETIAKNQDIMNIILIVLAAWAVPTFLSWGWTEFHKHLSYGVHVRRAISKSYDGLGADPHEWVRQRVYMHAVLSAFFASIAMGVAFILLENATQTEMIVLGVLHTIWSFIVGLASPWAWRVTFVHLIPALFAPAPKE